MVDLLHQGQQAADGLDRFDGYSVIVTVPFMFGWIAQW